MILNKNKRNKIIREVKKRIKINNKDFDSLSISEKIEIQNNYIEIVCVEKGFTLSDFYFADTKELDELLEF